VQEPEGRPKDKTCHDQEQLRGQGKGNRPCTVAAALLCWQRQQARYSLLAKKQAAVLGQQQRYSSEKAGYNSGIGRQKCIMSVLMQQTISLMCIYQRE
jgi:hypothetical protein